MLLLLRLSLGAVPRLACSRSDLLLEDLALRQQLLVLRARHPEPRLGTPDKLFWVLARWLWPNWKRSLIIVTPETVVRWHVFEVKKEIPIVGRICYKPLAPRRWRGHLLRARGRPAEPHTG
jgi:hypothetical protein